MTRQIDISGKTFTRLLALWPVGYRGGLRRVIIWACQCVEGNIVIAASQALRSGRIKSCGCLKNERVAELKWSHGWHGTPEYRSWKHARQRCMNPRDKAYRWYGARGIEFRFHSFAEFIAELGPKPSPDLEVDRINNDGHYEPGNVRWTTRAIQMANTRRALRSRP